MSDEFVEEIAIFIAEANNGGIWAKHYKEDQKNVWRKRAEIIIQKVSAQIQRQDRNYEC